MSEVLALGDRVRGVLRKAGFSSGSASRHGTTVPEGYLPSQQGFVVKRSYENRIFVDHAGKGRSAALPEYEQALRSAGLHVSSEPLRSGGGKSVLFVSDEPIAPRVPEPPTGPQHLRRGRATDEAFASATRCLRTIHTYSSGEESSECSPEEAAREFLANPKARMLVRDDGARVFVVTSHWGYTRYEMWIEDRPNRTDPRPKPSRADVERVWRFSNEAVSLTDLNTLLRENGFTVIDEEEANSIGLSSRRRLSRSGKVRNIIVGLTPAAVSAYWAGRTS